MSSLEINLRHKGEALFSRTYGIIAGLGVGWGDAITIKERSIHDHRKKISIEKKIPMWNLKRFIRYSKSIIYHKIQKACVDGNLYKNNVQKQKKDVQVSAE